ncbi:hypothetical protein GGD41_002518 [Paraburkholderia bryophila]|uniref:Uncharacterized protein n=1 Tax=Paraburkholderia bryophila TaxID=420952 RepID=A0A7Z0B078_9BURK|nr:hypothetical protein [Paraburkholderia bryophila]
MAAVARPARPFKAALMPIAMAIGAAMLPGTAAAQATTGNGGLELCPAGVGGAGSSWGPLSSAVGIMNCTAPAPVRQRDVVLTEQRGGQQRLLGLRR